MATEMVPKKIAFEMMMMMMMKFEMMTKKQMLKRKMEDIKERFRKG